MTRAARAVALALTAALLVPTAGSAAAPPGQLFYERTLVGAAGARCGLLAPPVAAALAASAHQARGAALRGGAQPAALTQVEARARARAAATPCASPDLALGIERVKAGFAGYARLNTMTFPGDLASWKADRTSPARAPSAWRLSQTARGPSGPVIFGLAEGDVLTVAAAWPGALAASGARLVLRDQTRAASAYIDPRRKDLAGRVAPRSVSVAFLASGRGPAGANLLPPGAAAGAAFRFPAAAVRALERLDPREAVMLELVFPTRAGERVERVAMEVGDFAAGRAFLMARN
jgi:hypothetical protein